MQKNAFFSALLSISLTTSLFSQLSGTYTIGGAGADFPNLTQAIQQLHTAGVSGPVVFKIRPGTYSAFTILTIAGASAARRVVFESENGDSTSVVIRGKSEFNGTRWVSFRKMTLTNNAGQKQAAVRLWNAHEIRVENCRIEETLPVSFDYDEGLIKIYTIQAPDSVRAYFLHCSVNASKNAVVSRGESGTFLFRWCTITGNWDFSIGAEYRGRFWNNEIHFHDEGGEYAKELHYNTIYTADSYLNLTAGSFVGNRITKLIHLSAATIEDNDFEGEVDLSFQPQSVVRRNTVKGDFFMAYCYAASVLNNEFFGFTSISFCDGLELCNNFVYNDLEITHGGDYRVFHNNFALGSHFDMGYTSGLVRNNNFSNIGITNLSITNIQDNNYYPTEGADYASFMDTRPRFYDPEFVDNAADLHATNPLLTAKAGLMSFPSTAKDFDGQKRPFPAPATIGANEICFTQAFPDTVWVSCTESSLLQWCDPAAAAGHFWTSTDFADTLAATANISNEHARYLYLHGPAGIEDTVFFAILPFNESFLSSRKYYAWCGDEWILNTYSPPGAQVSWSPGVGLSNPNSPKPVFSAQDTITYVASIQTGTCALLHDTVHIFVEQRPRAYFQLNNLGNGLVRFVNASTCADSYQWDFGDSTTATGFEPEHQYLSEGLYIVTLTATNDYGSATYQQQVYILLVNAGMPEDKPVSFQVFPNPSSGRFTIGMEAFHTGDNEIDLINAGGQILRSWHISGRAAAQLEVDAPDGWYCLLIRNQLGVFRKPLLLQALR